MPRQVVERGALEDPAEQAAEDWAVNAELLEGEELPGPRPPRKRQKRAGPPGEPRVPCSFHLVWVLIQKYSAAHVLLLHGR